MYFLAIIVFLGAVSINRSLKIIEKNTTNMERYTHILLDKTNRIDQVIEAIRMVQ